MMTEEEQKAIDDNSARMAKWAEENPEDARVLVEEMKKSRNACPVCGDGRWGDPICDDCMKRIGD